MNLIASRGCPFRCNWCAKPIFGDSYQLRHAREVAQEMRLLRDEYGAEHLWFADDIFALNRHWVQEFASSVEEFGCAVPFKIQARADLLTAETAHALKRAGCREVWMGVESGSQKVLDAMDKGLRVGRSSGRAPALERAKASWRATSCNWDIRARDGKKFRRRSRWCAKRVRTTLECRFPTRFRIRDFTRGFASNWARNRTGPTAKTCA